MTYQMVVDRNDIDIVEFDNFRDGKIVELINRFINRKKITANSKRAYKNDILKFFNVNYLEDVTFDMIIDIDTEQAQKYFDNSADSLRTKERIKSTLSSLYRFINLQTANNRNAKKLFEFIPFEGVELDGEKNSYGSLTFGEADRLITMGMKEDNLYWEILMTTGIRPDAIRILNLNENFKVIDGWNIIYGKDKGKNFEMAIPDEIYERCVRIADCDGNVFDFSYSTAQNRFKSALKRMGLSDDEINERYLVLHSLRKVSGDKAMAITDNLKEVQDHLRHSTPVYTSNLYIGKAKRDHSKDLSTKIKFGGNVDLDNSLREILRDNGVNYDVRDVLLGLDERTKKQILDGLGKIIKLTD